MSNFAILVDSTSDLGLDLRTKYEIDYCAMNINWDGVEHRASLDWDQGFGPHDFYQMMRDGKRVRTTMVPVSEYQTKFGEYLEKGMDILYIACSSGLSGSYNVALTVIKDLKEKYPNNRIVAYDCLNSGFGQGAQALKASDLRKEGRSIDEIVEVLTAERKKYNQFATVGNLKYLKAAGRVTAAAAFFGNMMAVKPILVSDIKGRNYAYKKVKGRKSSLDDIVKTAVETAEDIENNVIYIGHTDSLADAEYVKNEILKICNPKDVYIGSIGPIVGGSCGPDTIGIWCYGKECTITGE